MFDNFFQKYVTGKNVIFFVILILFLCFISQIQDIMIMFFATFVLACSMEPLVCKLSTKFNRNIAAIIILFAAILLTILILIPIIAIGGHEIANFAESFPQYMASLKDLIVSSPLMKYQNLSQIDVSRILSPATDVTTKVIGETINLGKNIGSGFVYLLASLIIIYYYMADKDKIKQGCIKMFPAQMRKRTSEVYDSIAQKIGGYVVAQIATMGSVGIIMTIGLLILGVNYALLLGLITCILDVVPVVGPFVALIICLIVSCKSGIGILIGICIVFAVAQLVENNFVRPYIFGKFLDIHPLIIYLFLFITAKYLGVIGVIFAPAIAATVVVLLEEVYIKNIE